MTQLTLLLLMAAAPPVTFMFLAGPAAAPPVEWPAEFETFDDVAFPAPDVVWLDPAEFSPPPLERPEPAYPVFQTPLEFDEWAPLPAAVLEEAPTRIDWERYAPQLLLAYFSGVLILLARLLLGVRGGWKLRRLARPVVEALTRPFTASD